MSRYIALTCSALARSIYAASATSPHAIQVRLLDQGLHNTPRTLREALQAHLDQITPEDCDAVLLAYGICGTSTVGVTARGVPVVMPRAHDCITLYLGSREQYQAEFDAHPGTYWYSVDYMENSKGGAGLGSMTPGEDIYETYVARYGKDNADYLMEVMGEWGKHYDRAVFIDTGLGDGARYEQMARDQAARRGWTYERKQGNRRLIELLVNGDWPTDEFLVVPPGFTLHQSSDEGLIDARPE